MSGIVRLGKRKGEVMSEEERLAAATVAEAQHQTKLSLIPYTIRLQHLENIRAVIGSTTNRGLEDSRKVSSKVLQILIEISILPFDLQALDIQEKNAEIIEQIKETDTDPKKIRKKAASLIKDITTDLLSVSTKEEREKRINHYFSLYMDGKYQGLANLVHETPRLGLYGKVLPLFLHMLPNCTEIPFFISEGTKGSRASLHLEIRAAVTENRALLIPFLTLRRGTYMKTNRTRLDSSYFTSDISNYMHASLMILFRIKVDEQYIFKFATIGIGHHETAPLAYTGIPYLDDTIGYREGTFFASPDPTPGKMFSEYNQSDSGFGPVFAAGIFEPPIHFIETCDQLATRSTQQGSPSYFDIANTAYIALNIKSPGALLGHTEPLEEFMKGQKVAYNCALFVEMLCDIPLFNLHVPSFLKSDTGALNTAVKFYSIIKTVQRDYQKIWHILKSNVDPQYLPDARHLFDSSNKKAAYLGKMEKELLTTLNASIVALNASIVVKKEQKVQKVIDDIEPEVKKIDKFIVDAIKICICRSNNDKFFDIMRERMQEYYDDEELYIRNLLLAYIQERGLKEIKKAYSYEFIFFISDTTTSEHVLEVESLPWSSFDDDGLDHIGFSEERELSSLLEGQEKRGRAGINPDFEPKFGYGGSKSRRRRLKKVARKTRKYELKFTHKKNKKRNRKHRSTYKYK